MRGPYTRQIHRSPPVRSQMRTRIAKTLSAIALPLLAMAGCGSGGSEPSSVTVTTTAPLSASSSAPEASSAATSATPTTASTQPAATAPAKAPVADQCGAVGFTGAPGHESPHCLGKQIASCGTSDHQAGTTFFTDGTSGWTQTCQDQMLTVYVPPPPPTFDQDAYNQQFADEYWRTHPKPTFDPDSADGYGPDQELPPACLRLVGVDC